MIASGTTRRKTGTMEDLYDHFQRSRLFSCLSDVQTQQIIESSTLRQLPTRSPISVPGEQGQVVHLLLEGRAKVCYMTRDGKQPILYFVGRDELIGEQSIFSGAVSEDHVETIESSVVASISTRVLRGLVLAEPTFSTSLCELISRRRRETEERIRHLLFLSNRERLTHLLLDLAQRYGKSTMSDIDLEIKLSHQDLANFIGSTRETVTVVLGKMQEEGLLAVRRRRITLHDGHSLARSVNRELDVAASPREN